MSTAFFGTSQARISCTPNGVILDMFSGPYGGFFGFPDDFATLPIGARVGPLREVNLRYNCTFNTLNSREFGTGMKATPGITSQVIPGVGTVYTTTQLSALGLGYQMWWHEVSSNGTNLTPAIATHSNTNPMQDSLPDQWYNHTSTLTRPNTRVATRLIFFKISNAFQNTNGAYQAASISTNLFTIYATSKDAPGTIRGTAYTYNLKFTQFASAKRVCTPHVQQTIQFDYLTAGEVSSLPVGSIDSSTKDFTLTFNCPQQAYYWQGFRMEPVYGVLDSANRVIGIKTGAGMAQGMGIQVLVKDVASGWINSTATTTPTDMDNYTSPWQVVIPNQNYAIPAFQYLESQQNESQQNVNPATNMRSKQVNFRARYYRMPGTITGGKVESAVIFHFVYQ